MDSIPSLSPADLRSLLDRNEPVVLLDVRENDEVAIAAIAGSTHIPMNDVPSRFSELDPGARTVVYCHRGVRSQMVAAFLKRQGFRDVSNLAGGIDHYSVAVDPELPRY